MLLPKIYHNLLTSHKQQASTSSITPVPSARNTSPKQWVQDAPSLTITTTDGRTSYSSTERIGRASQPRSGKRWHSIAITETAPSPMSPKPQVSPYPSTGWVSLSPITITMAIQISTSAPLKPTDSSKTAAMAPLLMSRKSPVSTIRASAPAARGSTTITMDILTSTSRTTLNGA